MNNHTRRGRHHRALLISLIVHLCFAMAVTIVIYRGSQKAFEDTIAIAFVDQEKLAEPRRKIKPPPPKRMTLPQTIRASVEAQPETARLRKSANPINETVIPSMNPLLYSAVNDKLNIVDQLPDVTTAAKIASHRGATIAEQVSTRYQTTDGDGVRSTRQRVAGDGTDGLHAIESTGVSDVGTVDSSSQKPGGSMKKGDSPFGQALRNIANHIIATREKDKVNVVFVLDTSKSMQDNIQQIAAHLYSMTDAYDEINLKYFLGMTEFSVRDADRRQQQLKRWSLTPDVTMLRRRMQDVQLGGSEFGLDALIQTLNSMEFHPEADKHLVLITDEPASTSYTKSKTDAEAVTEMREKVVSNCKLEEVRVNVLGHTEAFQRQLAEETGGLWQEISGGLVQRGSLPPSRSMNQEFLKYFRDIATNIRQSSRRVMFDMDAKYAEDLDDKGNLISMPIMRMFKKNGNPLSVKAAISIQEEGNRWIIVDGTQTYTAIRGDDKIKFYRSGSAEAHGSKIIADIVIMLDYSRSMGGKSEVVMLGLSELIGKLDILPIKYELRLIRFAEAKDAIKSIDGTVVTPIPLNEAQLKTLMAEPFGGDEHLIDAIVEGLPKIPFRPNAHRFLIVLTDEPTTGNLAPEQALEVCQSLEIRAFVIGVDRSDTMFQSTLAKATHGLFFPMPKGFAKTYPYQ